MKRNKLIGLLVATVIVVTLIVPGCGGEESSTTEITAWNIPYMTITSGFLAGPYSQMTWAFQAAIDEINAAGGVNGIPVKVTVYDNGADAATAHAQMLKILETKPLIIVDNSVPYCVDAYSALVIEDEALLINLVSDNSSEQYRPWILRASPYTENQGGPTLALWAQRDPDIQTVQPIIDGSFESIKVDMGPKNDAALEAVGITVLDPIEFPGVTTLDYGPTAIEALSRDADAYTFIAQDISAAKILLEMHRRGFTENEKVIFNNFADSPTFQELTAGGVADGCYMWQDIYLDCDTELWQAIEGRWNAQNPGEYLDKVAAIRAIDMAQMVIYALEHTGVTGDPAKLQEERELLRAALYNVEDFGAVCGNVSMVDGIALRDQWLVEMRGDDERIFVEKIETTVPPGYDAPPLP